MKEWLLNTLVLVLLALMLCWYLQRRRKALPAVLPKSKTLAGVHGWLLFFCIILVFLFPFNLLRGINFHDAEKLQAEYPRVMTITFIDSFFAVALIVYSIYTGVRLWRVRPRAVANAKRFLLVIWIYSIINYLSLFTVGFPQEVNALLLRRLLLWRLPILTFFVLAWWMYLVRSKRVAATYGDEKALSPTEKA